MLPLKILSNIPLPKVPAAETVHFGECRVRPLSQQRNGPEYERRSMQEILAQVPNGFSPDVLLFRSPEYLPIPDDIHLFRGSKVLVITDWNVSLRFLPELCQQFDLCFTDAPGVRILRKAGVQNIYHQLLYGFNPSSFHYLNLNRDLDLSFCGNINASLHRERNRLLFRLAHWGQNRTIHLGQAFGKKYEQILNRSRLVFNYSVRGEANMRLYEAMACGAVVLVEKTNEEVPLIFKDGIHYIAYEPKDLESVCNALLKDPDRLESIGREAQKAVQAQTQACQFSSLVTQIQNLSSGAGFEHSHSHPRSGKSTSALKKMRLLGMGYTIHEAIQEVESRQIDDPDFAAETLPSLITCEENSLQDAYRKAQVEGMLENPIIPRHFAEWIKMVWAIGNEQWLEAQTYAEKGLEKLEALVSLSPNMDPGYGLFYPPLQLGHPLNGDLNFCFREYLELGNHSAYVNLMKNLKLSGAAIACMQLEKDEDSLNFALKMNAGRWTGVSPWPVIFTLCLTGENDRNILEEVVQSWLQDSPLDIKSWDQILRGLRTGRQWELYAKFASAIQPVAQQFFTQEKWESLFPVGQIQKTVERNVDPIRTVI